MPAYRITIGADIEMEMPIAAQDEISERVEQILLDYAEVPSGVEVEVEELFQ